MLERPDTRIQCTVVGRPWEPETVWLRGGGELCRESSRPLPDTRISSGRGTAIEFPTRFLFLPVPGAVASVAEAGAAPSQAWREEPSRELAGSLRQSLSAYLADGSAGIDLGARLAGTSVRTLQRYLANAGLTFSKLMEETRRETALRLIEDPTIKLIDVSVELGYSDPAHFTRAFRRWTGVPPSALRARGHSTWSPPPRAVGHD